MPLSRSIRRLSAALVFSFVMSPCVYGQTTPAARRLLDEMITALGGDVFLEVRTIHTSGRFFNFKRNEISASDLYNDYVKYPDMELTEFGKDKNKTAYINRGDKGWIVSPPPKKGDPEVQEQSGSQAEEFIRSFRTALDYVVRFVLKDPRASVISTGPDIVGFKRVDVLEIRDPDKNLIRVFLERDTRLPLKTQTRFANESVVHEDEFANWHRFDGVMTPLLVIRRKDGVKTMEIRAEFVEYNSVIPDTMFAPPSGTE